MMAVSFPANVSSYSPASQDQASAKMVKMTCSGKNGVARGEEG
jgi:hypothetical protein